MALERWSRDLLPLELLLDVDSLGSVGKAAAAHGITQPAASARLDRLERETRLQLLNRSSSGSTLTPEGQVFASWARDVLAAAQTMTDGVAALRHTHTARLRIAASLTVAEYVMPVWLLRLRRENQDLDVTAAVANSHEVCDRVRAGQADVGFVEMPVVPAGFGCRQVGEDRLALVAAPDYPAVHASTPLTATDLLDRPLLLREEGSGTRDTFVFALARALGTSTTPALPHAVELGSTTTILATARAGGGIGVISQRAAAADLRTGGLATVPVTGLDLRRPLNAIWVGRAAAPAAASLIDIARRFAEPGAQEHQGTHNQS